MISYEDLLARFKVVERNGDTAKCICPCHNDNKASLSVTNDPVKRIFKVHCLACGKEKTEDILDAVGLTINDLFYDNKDTKRNWKSNIETFLNNKIKDCYDYTDEKGSYAYTKVRFIDKTFRFGVVSSDKTFFNMKAVAKDANNKRIPLLYNLKDILSVDKSTTVFYVEGEKDVETMRSRGLVAVTAGGAADWKRQFTKYFKDLNVVIAADNDEAGKRLASEVMNDLKGVAVSVKCITPSTREHGDITDYFEDGFSVDDLKALIYNNNTYDKDECDSNDDIEEVAIFNSQFKNIYGSFDIELNSKGYPLHSISNIAEILRNDKKYSGNMKFNELSCNQEFCNTKFSDNTASEIRMYIENKYKIYNKEKVNDAIRIVCNENAYNPIKDIIEGTEWDRNSRVEIMLSKWLKAEDDEYTREVSRVIFAGGINRLYNAGCKFDEVAVLVGEKQGEGKSTFVRFLNMDDEYFNEIKTFEGKSGVEAVRGRWICELAELMALTNAKEVETVKAYITCQVDKERMAYDRYISDMPRSCIFIGTTNKIDFLVDKTGNRRFLPVAVNSEARYLFENIEEFKNDIRQCWAEALYLYKKSDFKCHFSYDKKQLAIEHQAASTQDDYRIGMVEEYIETNCKQKLCAIEVWENALYETKKPNKKESMEINMILSRLNGWKRMDTTARFGKYGVQRGFEIIKLPF